MHGGTRAQGGDGLPVAWIGSLAILAHNGKVTGEPLPPLALVQTGTATHRLVCLDLRKEVRPKGSERDPIAHWLPAQSAGAGCCVVQCHGGAYFSSRSMKVTALMPAPLRKGLHTQLCCVAKSSAACRSSLLGWELRPK